MRAQIVASIFVVVLFISLFLYASTDLITASPKSILLLVLSGIGTCCSICIALDWLLRERSG